MILDAETFDAPATTVYNLTVATTHAYFVGPRGLLVHNVCGFPGTSKRRLQAQREEEGRNAVRQRLAESEAREAARKGREARARARRQASGVNDEPGRPNCVYCTLAGLSDFDKLSLFFEKTGLNRWNADGTHRAPSMDQILELMSNLGLTSRDTPPLQDFPNTASEIDAAAEAAKGAKESSSRPIFPYGEQATEFMQGSRANTFLVQYAHWNGSSYQGHVLLAVKKRVQKPDGSIVSMIVYLDLQTHPPETYHHLDPHIFSVTVVPTDIDWRFNRVIYGYVETRQPMLQQTQQFHSAQSAGEASADSSRTSAARQHQPPRRPLRPR
jgi:hypothetical protein